VPDALCVTHGRGCAGDDADDYDRPLSLKERLKLYTVGLIRPEGRTKWDLFILMLLVWVLFASPVIICFGLTVRACVRVGLGARGTWVAGGGADVGCVAVAPKGKGGPGLGKCKV
jgi:hypothetical protein